MVEGWRDRTPPGFGFSLKVPQSITHEKVLLDCREEVEAFLSVARLLGDKLLCCCLQFAYFNTQQVFLAECLSGSAGAVPGGVAGRRAPGGRGAQPDLDHPRWPIACAGTAPSGCCPIRCGCPRR
jgi:uncharacterized protein YecE (DUF72 family)